MNLISVMQWMKPICSLFPMAGKRRHSPKKTTPAVCWRRAALLPSFLNTERPIWKIAGHWWRRLWENRWVSHKIVTSPEKMSPKTQMPDLFLFSMWKPPSTWLKEAWLFAPPRKPLTHTSSSEPGISSSCLPGASHSNRWLSLRTSSAISVSLLHMYVLFFCFFSPPPPGCADITGWCGVWHHQNRDLGEEQRTICEAKAASYRPERFHLKGESLHVIRPSYFIPSPPVHLN